MSTVDIEKLKALAEKCAKYFLVSEPFEEDRHYPLSEIESLEFSAAANPAAVLELIAEIELDNKIIAERELLLSAIPECAAHGKCVPYAIQWVKDTQTQVAELLEERDQLKAENEALRKDAERLDWLDRQYINIVEGQTFLDPHGELVAHEWSVRGPFGAVRDAIDDAMSPEQQP